MKNRTLFSILLAAMVLMFLSGIISLFNMRFKSGDIYPAYSSLRSDPLGTKVLFESLGSIQGLSVSRNYAPFDKIQASPDESYFIFGVQKSSFIPVSKKETGTLESAIIEGGQLVMTFWPERKPPFTIDIKKKKLHADASPDDQDEGKEMDEASDEKGPEKKACGTSGEDIAGQWDVSFEYSDMSESADNDNKRAAILADSRLNLPDSVPWHSGIHFNISASEWDVIYTVDDYPVIIERNMGKGRIIFATDTYAVSNEAMLKERHPDLLAWLTGDNRKIIFDETHFGIMERPSIMSLVRKYRLHGVVAAFIVLSGLYIWKNSSSLLPPDENDSRVHDTQSVRDYLSGLVNLLRRNIPASDILRVCVREWEKSTTRKQNNDEVIKRIGLIAETEKRLPRKQRNARTSYETIRHVLTKRRYT